MQIELFLYSSADRKGYLCVFVCVCDFAGSKKGVLRIAKLAQAPGLFY